MTPTTDTLVASYPFLEARPSVDWPAVNCPQESLHDFLKELKDTHGFTFLADVTAVDHESAEPRFEVIYHLYHIGQHSYIRVATPCVGGSDPVCASVTDLWATADWHERECYDMFGIQFSGHPDLRRILMWDGYPYFPLRKEFPLAGKEVELPSPDLTEMTQATAKPAPMMGGPFHAGQTGHMSDREPRADDESWTETREKH
jgi:NADH-quinone oxidoreductase subunit C